MPSEIDQVRRAAADWLVRLREDPHDEELNSAFEAWRSADLAHEEAWAGMTATAAALGRAAPGGQAERRASRSAARRPIVAHWKPAAGLAAAACLLLVILPQLGLYFGADYGSRPGQLREIALEDGTQVVLGPDSAIDVAYSDGARAIHLLDGRAAFEVAHDPDRPFTVAADDLTATVLGTGFDVRMAGGATGVAVRHGRVRVEAASLGEPYELAAGDWIRIAAAAGAETGAQDPETVAAWRDGQIMVRNRSIAEVVDELRPWYYGHIFLTDSALAGMPVTGVYDADDPAAALALMVDPYGGKVMRLSPWLLVVTAD